MEKYTIEHLKDFYKSKPVDYILTVDSVLARIPLTRSTEMISFRNYYLSLPKDYVVTITSLLAKISEFEPTPTVNRFSDGSEYKILSK